MGVTYPPAFASKGLPLGSNSFVVGDGQYATINDALAAAASLSLSASNRAVVYITPGTYTLTAFLDVPAWCALVGVERDSCIIVTSIAVNIRYNKNSVLANFSVEHSGAGGSSNAIRDDSLSGTADDSTLYISNVKVTVTSAAARPAIRITGIQYAVVNDCLILTCGYGVWANNAAVLHIRDTDIFLTNENTGGVHYGIYKNGGNRMTVWGGKIASGYGPATWPSTTGIENEADQEIIGIFIEGASSRVDLHDCWVNVRNETGANAGVDVVAVKHSATAGVVRVHGGYYQAEDGGADAGDRFTFMNTSTPSGPLGYIYLHNDVRARLVSGAIQTLSSDVTNEISADVTLGLYQQGAFLVDMSGGSVTVTLPAVPAAYQQVTVIRKNATNTLTVDGNGNNISGSATVTVGATAYDMVAVKYFIDADEWVITSTI